MSGEHTDVAAYSAGALAGAAGPRDKFEGQSRHLPGMRRGAGRAGRAMADLLSGVEPVDTTDESPDEAAVVRVLVRRRAAAQRRRKPLADARASGCGPRWWCWRAGPAGVGIALRSRPGSITVMDRGCPRPFSPRIPCDRRLASTRRWLVSKASLRDLSSTHLGPGQSVRGAAQVLTLRRRVQSTGQRRGRAWPTLGGCQLAGLRGCPGPRPGPPLVLAGANLQSGKGSCPAIQGQGLWSNGRTLVKVKDPRVLSFAGRWPSTQCRPVPASAAALRGETAASGSGCPPPQPEPVAVRRPVGSGRGPIPSTGTLCF